MILIIHFKIYRITLFLMPLCKNMYFKTLLIFYSFKKESQICHIHFICILLQIFNRRNMLKNNFRRKTSLECQDIANLLAAETQNCKQNHQKDPETPQLIQKAFTNHQTEESLSEDNQALPVNLVSKQANIIQTHSESQRIKLRNNDEKVGIKLRRRQPSPLKKSANKVNRIHHMSQEKQLQFSQMFLGRSGIRGQKDKIQLQKSRSLQQSGFKLPLKITNDSFGLHSLQKSNFATNQLKQIYKKREDHLKILQKSAQSKQTLKESKEQDDRIQQLLNRAKVEINKGQLFKLTSEKQRILDIKLRQRIKSDIAQKKLKEKIEKVREKMKSLSASKKKQNQFHNYQKKQRFQYKKMLQREEQMNKFKNIFQNKGVKKLILR